MCTRILYYSRNGHAKKGGAEISFKELASRLDCHDDLEVTRVYNHLSRPATDFAQLSPRAYSLRLSTVRPLHWTVSAWTRSFRVTLRLLRMVRPDVVVCHYMDTTSLYFVLLKAFFGYKLVYAGMGSDLLVAPHGGRLERRIFQFMLRHTDFFVGVSEPVRRAAVRLAPHLASRAAVVWNGIDVGFWSQRPPEAQPPTVPTLFACGALRPVKGLDVLIEALPRVREQYPDLRLRIAGQGADADALRELAASLGVAEAIEWMGWCDHAAVRRALYESTLFVMPSRSEGLPGSLMEAMATGTPVVASEVGGIPTLVMPGKTGWLVPPEDPEALAEALLHLLGDADLRTQLGAAGQAFIRQNTWDRSVARYREIFHRVAA